MRIINLDDTGIKIIASNKKQMYLTTTEIKDFIARKYILNGNNLVFGTKNLDLSTNEVEEFSDIYEYIKTNFEHKV